MTHTIRAKYHDTCRCAAHVSPGEWVWWSPDHGIIRCKECKPAPTVERGWWA